MILLVPLLLHNPYLLDSIFLDLLVLLHLLHQSVLSSGVQLLLYSFDVAFLFALDQILNENVL